MENGNKQKVLLIDNDISTLLNFASWASAYDVQGTTDLNVALHWIEGKKIKYDLVIISTEIRGLTIYNIAKKLKSLVKCSIVLLSAKDDLNEVNVINSGVDFILYKPIVRRDVKEILSFAKYEVTSN